MDARVEIPGACMATGYPLPAKVSELVRWSAAALQVAAILQRDRDWDADTISDISEVMLNAALVDYIPSHVGSGDDEGYCRMDPDIQRRMDESAACEVCGVWVRAVDLHAAHYCDAHRPADYDAQMRGEEPQS